MSSLLTRLRDKAQPQAAALLPGNRFFVRRIPLDGPDVQAQVNLALEALSPFPLEQMLVGHLVAADGRSALVYAAHRRRFTPEESLAWPEDCQVVPEFLALCSHRPAADGVVLHRGEERVTALAWKAGEPLPAAIAVAELADVTEAEIAAEVAARADLAPGYAIETLTGALRGEQREKALFLFAEGATPHELSKKHLDVADIRDTDFLEARRKKEQANLILWRLTQAAVATLVVALALDLVGLGVRLRTGDLEAKNAVNAEKVADIDAAQAITTRINELGVKRPLPLEMLALVNEHRPATLEFQSVTCKSNVLLEIGGRTSNAADIGVFERELAALPMVASAVSRDIRTRETSATFTLAITFKLDALRKAVTAPKQP
ncbi:MAG: hypothetical protein RL250_286 [Verrucomicrobiota bacterium]